jgi:peptidoglycan-associated lipoprotein
MDLFSTREPQLKPTLPRILATLVSVVLLGSGCGTKNTQPDDAANAGTAVGADGSDAARTSGVATVDAGQGNSGHGALGPDGPLGSQRIIYFDYDSSDIRADYADVVAAHGKFLSSNAAVRVRLEGHSDERGTREYNIGLGERRAQAVRRALALQGVQESQISTVSYGEERPAAIGSDENAYSKNRRVEIVYIN